MYTYLIENQEAHATDQPDVESLARPEKVNTSLNLGPAAIYVKIPGTPDGVVAKIKPGTVLNFVSSNGAPTDKLFEVTKDYLVSLSPSEEQSLIKKVQQGHAQVVDIDLN